ncbi:hypothetical protein SAMN05444266_101744 [Chitinophaga jiangningensis]|uniref:YXWGXW repeat-containing protein n=1 Tax=Chitinophaga jiangningensis TaxID=1419482 RepID=A0A1M6WSF3_9BACT|nr:hypothetical protein [Chitinophaga jiangningensis]SHK96571.1 hypothetical protein SAMN05444266_101744 [Chitinophaga jiangningensis]
MKKATILLIAAMIAGVSINKSFAQVRVNINIGSQPLWGPTGYDYVQYYYLPDVDAYYDVPNRQFIYQERNRWIYASALPAYYHYDIDRCYKVVVNERDPFRRADYYRNTYGRYKGYYDRQPLIRNSRDVRYVQVRRDYRDNDRRYFADDHDNRNHNSSWRINQGRDNRNDRNDRWDNDRRNGHDNRRDDDRRDHRRDK